MAARTRKPFHDDRTREKIRTSQLINRLHAHVFEGVEISQTQLRAIEILLKKTMPDLSASDNRNETTVTYVAELPAVAPSVNEWLKSSGVPSPDRKLN